MKARRYLAALACLAAGACGPAEPGVYDLPRQEVYRLLASNTLDAIRLQHSCGVLIHLKPSARNGTEIDWRVTHNGNLRLKFSVRLEEVTPERTRVKLSIDSKKEDGSEFYDGDHWPGFPAVQQPVRPGIEEAIAATLEGREFDKSRAPRNEDDDACDVQRATLESRGIPVDVLVQRSATDGPPTSAGWGSGTRF